MNSQFDVHKRVVIRLPHPGFREIFVAVLSTKSGVAQEAL